MFLFQVSSICVDLMPELKGYERRVSCFSISRRSRSLTCPRANSGTARPRVSDHRPHRRAAVEQLGFERLADQFQRPFVGIFENTGCAQGA
jgi:hypothetical protein